jgi:hypothetical protein
MLMAWGIYVQGSHGGITGMSAQPFSLLISDIRAHLALGGVS